MSPMLIKIKDCDHDDTRKNPELVFRYLAFLHRTHNSFLDSKEKLQIDDLQCLKKAVCKAFTEYYKSNIGEN